MSAERRYTGGEFKERLEALGLSRREADLYEKFLILQAHQFRREAYSAGLTLAHAYGVGMVVEVESKTGKLHRYDLGVVLEPKEPEFYIRARR